MLAMLAFDADKATDRIGSLVDHNHCLRQCSAGLSKALPKWRLNVRSALVGDFGESMGDNCV